MNVKVNLHDEWVGGLEISTVLDTLLHGSGALRKLVMEAEVMLLYGSPLGSNPPDGSWDGPGGFHACFLGGYEGKNLQPGFDTYKNKMLNSCAPETFVTYKTQLRAVLDEIDKIREGRPLILRMTNQYIAWHSYWIDSGVNEVCTICAVNYSEAIRQVAEEYGIPVASKLTEFNGIDYMSDAPAEYIGEDGVHISEAGAQFVATILQKTGYEYAGK